MSVENKRGRRRKTVGKVIGNKMQRPIVVEVVRFVKHSKCGKYLKRSSIYKTHDQNNEAKVGDKVEIIESKPLSKTKSTRLHRIIEKAKP